MTMGEGDRPGYPDSPSRVWAALTNLAGLLIGLGPIASTAGWAQSREKSPFATFHALQALGYQTLGYTVWLVAVLLVVVLFMCALFPLVGLVQEAQSQTWILAWMGLHFAAVAGMFVVYLVLAVLAAIFTALGRDFRYPWLGRRLGKYLRYDPMAGPAATVDEVNADRWVAAMSQFAIILPVWGLVTPAIALVTQRNRSPFLRFQSWQAIAFHLLGFPLYSVGWGLLGVSSFVLLLTAGASGAVTGPSSEGIASAGLLLYLALNCCAGLLALLIPVYHIAGQWAGLRILRGQDYRYPLLGRWLARRLNYPTDSPAIRSELLAQDQPSQGLE
jgi:uncharacterized Tic20 family protein